MDNIKLYRVSAAYIEYLLPYAPHLYHNSQKGQQNEARRISRDPDVKGYTSMEELKRALDD